MDSKSWDERYVTGTQEALPWDTGEPAPELVAYFQILDKAPARALEIGCGTGTNAIWMAKQGSNVIATDVSQQAIATAREKAKKADVNGVQFVIEDILEKNAVPLGSVDFVFDRGVYHVMDVNARSVFTQRVAEALADGGFWLCLAGCADEVRENMTEGPPQLKAQEVIDVVEKHFEIHKLERATFVIPNGKQYLCWIVLMRKRPQETRSRFA